jgi:hypothetical protein
MISLLFLLLATFLLICVTIYFYNKYNIAVADIERRENFLKNQRNDFDSQKLEQETKHRLQMDRISQKEIELSQYYQKVLLAKEEVFKIREQSKIQVAELKKQIDKLQSDLNNSRQKAKRLAENNLKLV